MTETKQYLYQIYPTRLEMVTEGPTPEEAEIMGQHFAYLQNLLADGVMILVGRTQNRDESTFGLAVFKAESDEAAITIMNNDPAVSRGLMRARLFPYKVALISEANSRSDA